MTQGNSSQLDRKAEVRLKLFISYSLQGRSPQDQSMLAITFKSSISRNIFSHHQLRLQQRPQLNVLVLTPWALITWAVTIINIAPILWICAWITLLRSIQISCFWQTKFFENGSQGISDPRLFGALITVVCCRLWEKKLLFRIRLPRICAAVNQLMYCWKRLIRTTDASSKRPSHDIINRGKLSHASQNDLSPNINVYFSES